MATRCALPKVWFEQAYRVSSGNRLAIAAESLARTIKADGRRDVFQIA